MEDQYREEEFTATPAEPDVPSSAQPNPGTLPDTDAAETIPVGSTPAAEEPVTEDFSVSPDDSAPVTPDHAPIPENVYPVPPFTPPVQRIEYSPVVPTAPQKATSKGIKVFAVILAFAIFLTGFSAVGYYIGRFHSAGNTGKTVKVDLAAKPKDTDEMTAGEVYEKAKNSVAGIMAYDGESTILVSGVFFSKDGYVVTNDHIYEKISDPKFLIYTADGKQYEAEFVAGDSVSDLTVLKTKSGSFEPAVFGDPEEMFCGENVVLMENIGDSGNRVTVSRGTVISTGIRVRRESSSYSQKLIATDNTVINNATGAALVNMYGQVVGLTSYTNGSGVCYSISSKQIKRYVEDMIANGRITTRPKLGITYQYIGTAKKKAKDYAATGALIESIASDSDLTGKVSKGDIVTGFNGVKIKSEDQLLDLIEDCVAKDKATVTVVDESGKEKTVEFVLGTNIGESSYQKPISSEESDDPFSQNPNSQSPDNGSGGGTFDFPRGE